MKRVIHKIQLKDVETKILVSDGAFKVVHVSEQDGCPTLWYETIYNLVIPIEVTFRIIGTGDYIPDHSEYVGTAFCGNFVWHVYQVPITTK